MKHALVDEVIQLMAKAGYEVIFPEGMERMCCGQIWESKGMLDIADRKSAELEQALWEASEHGKYPVLCAQSPCLHRMRKVMGKQEQSDARIDSAEREQARPTVKTRDAQRTMMRRLLTFFKNEGFKGGQFNLDGTEPTGNYTEGMAGANAVGAFALADSDNEEDRALAREYVQRLWDVQPPTGKWRYYVGMVYFLSMLHVSGHFGLS